MKKILKKLTKIGLMWQFLPGAPNCPNPPGGTSWACATTKDIEIVLRAALKGFIGIMGVLAVLMFIIGGYNYLLAYGNEEKAEKGKKTILWAIVGIVVTLLAWVIVSEVWKITTGGPPPTTAP